MNPSDREAEGTTGLAFTPVRPENVNITSEYLGRAEVVFRETFALTRLLFEQNPHPMWLFDVPTFRFLAVNGAAVAVYGYSRVEFLSMNLRDLHPKEDALRFESYMRRIGVGKVFAGRWRLRASDGRLLESEQTWHTIATQGAKLGLTSMEHIKEASPRKKKSGAACGADGFLGAREKQVVRLLAEGKRSKEIALTLGISPHTVGTHRKVILHKLGLHNTVEMVRMAIRNGIVEA